LKNKNKNVGSSLALQETKIFLKQKQNKKEQKV
jgi:hypothetical protein